MYKKEDVRTLTNKELRELVDVLLMAIHWQGFRINDEEVLKAICKQHEDQPTWATFDSGSHAASKAHKRILKLFEDEKCVRYLKVLQECAARGDTTPDV